MGTEDETERTIRVGRAAALLLDHELFPLIDARVTTDIIQQWQDCAAGADPIYHSQMQGWKTLLKRLRVYKEDGEQAARKVEADNAMRANKRR